jgi:hypothetical protein
MLALIIVVGATVAVPAVADLTSVAVQPLPNDRTGVVVDWRARSGTATVALRSGRLLAIHSLRRVQPGTRVRVDGIKWDTPTSGIKWSVPPQGIKWGIKWSRNGTYSSRLNALRRVGGTRVRGVVVQRFGGAVAIGTPGGIVVVRMAVWLPKTGHARTNALVRPVRGDTITTNVTIGRRGRLHGDGARILASGARVIAVSGRLSAIDTANRSIRISNISDPSYPVHANLAVPSTIDMARLAIGSEVVVSAGVTPAGTMRVNQIARNETFAAGNDPANIQVAPPSADAKPLELLRQAIGRWTAGHANGEITDQAVYDAELARLQRADAAARDGNRPVARTELDAFITDVMAARPGTVADKLATDVLALAAAAFEQLK